MPYHISDGPVIRRVRAILLTEQGQLLFIKRVKPDKPPYWVAPGGGVEDKDAGLIPALNRELMEELGAEAEIVRLAFVLRHRKAEKNLEEFFYICRLVTYDLNRRCGPEFNDPSRGLFLPDFIYPNVERINAINIKTEELREWLLANLDTLG